LVVEGVVQESCLCFDRREVIGSKIVAVSVPWVKDGLNQRDSRTKQILGFRSFRRYTGNFLPRVELANKVACVFFDRGAEGVGMRGDSLGVDLNTELAQSVNLVAREEEVRGGVVESGFDDSDVTIFQDITVLRRRNSSNAITQRHLILVVAERR
jgi:hypothetical protein